MTVIVKGFVTINSFVNNTPGQVSALGELSAWSRTYSKEKGEYQQDDIPGYRLTTFKVVDNVTGVQQVLGTPIAREAIQVVASCIQYATTHIRPYDSIDFKNTLLTNFFQKVTDLHMGDFRDNGSIALPEWLSWTSAENNNAVIKIWLSDPAFQDQYDEYEIVVIPPINTVDNLFNAYNLALTEINSRTSAQMSDKIETVKGVNPETYLRLLDFNFVNRINTTQVNKTTWAVLVYGKVGDNIDSIKDAIVEYVLTNSTHTKSEWEVILPDIFKRTEFVLLPRWDKISIPNLGNLSSLYSSAVSPLEAIAYAKRAINFYSTTFIDSNITIFPYDYKALAIVAVNGNTNIEGSETLFGLFPDYIPVPSTSADFNRMQVKTRNWLIFLEQLLIIAETATQFTSVPLFARKQYRNNLLYISGMYDNVNYLIAAKSNTI
jgi:hypothetical protein